MYLVFSGSLSSGLRPVQSFPDPEQAEDFVVRLMADGKLAESLPVESPQSSDEHPEGSVFILLRQGAFDPVTLIGPFLSSDEAQIYTEEKALDAWELFDLDLLIQGSSPQKRDTSTPLNRPSRADWNALCTEQGWNDPTKILFLEDFVEERRLFPAFVARMERIAEEENGAGDLVF